MVLIYSSFNGTEVFKWCHRHMNRITVLFPAEAFFDRCVDKVLKEYRLGKEVLAWGNSGGLEQLRNELRKRHIPAVTYVGESARRPPKPKPTTSSPLPF